MLNSLASALPELVLTYVQMLRMLKYKRGLQIGAFVALASVTLCCAVLVILLLAQEETQRAGIATLSLTVRYIPIAVFYLANKLKILVQY